MSAFICSDEVINRVADFCYGLQFKQSGPLCGIRWSRPINDRSLFARELFGLNVKGVAARYDDVDDMLPDVPYEYRPEPCGDLFQVLKSLDCFLYQCSEGQVPELPLFRELDTLRARLTRALVTARPEYEAARWD